MTLLDTLNRAGHLRTLDHALAQSLRRLDLGTPDAVLAAAALASLAVAKGHAGLKLDAAHELIDDPEVTWPDPNDWRQQLAASPWVATPGNPAQPSPTGTPLVLEHDLLYLRRYREYERTLSHHLHRIAAPAARIAPAVVRAPAPAVGARHAREAHTAPEAIAPIFTKLFPEAQTTPDDLQARAAALALHHNLLLVTGGPGTGKTTTIARMLVLLAAQAREAGQPAPRIALAAPTGRAAERMAESLRNALQPLTALGIDDTLLAPLPTAGTTLHRLLGTIPDSPRFRHNADNPLLLDVVVVDEASMIDLPLMAKLAEAVPDGARLVLLGDPDQLPSVEAGDVLSGILRATGDGTQLHPDDAAALKPLLGESASARHSRAGGNLVTSGGEEGDGFPGRRIHLTHGWRQSASLDLAPLATAIREGDTNTTLTLLREGDLSGVHFHENLADPLHAHRESFLTHWTSLAEAGTPSEALALAARLRILTAVREGPQGARSLNARIEAMLAGPQAQGRRHFHGQPVIVTENSDRHRLFNGDTGIILCDANGSLMAWFPGADPHTPRAFHPAALPAHESAFVMTVHKAQGSEFDTVWLLLPVRPSRVLSRELVYTAITRARRELHLAGSAPVIEAALLRHVSRWSGLGPRLSLRPETLHGPYCT